MYHGVSISESACTTQFVVLLNPFPHEYSYYQAQPTLNNYINKCSRLYMEQSTNLSGSIG